MKAQEIIDSIKSSEESTGNWYANRTVGLMDLWGDLNDAIEEGYIEGVSVKRPNDGRLIIKCKDGTVFVRKGAGKLTYNKVIRPKITDIPVATARTPTHYERTRAMVYATGNKWAIENFNATH